MLCMRITDAQYTMYFKAFLSVELFVFELPLLPRENNCLDEHNSSTKTSQNQNLLFIRLNSNYYQQLTSVRN